MPASHSSRGPACRPGRRQRTRCATRASISAGRALPSSCAIRPGMLRDLTWTPDSDVDVEPVRADSADGLAVLRHSAAHVLAQAVQELFPGTLLGIGPPIENGFYYDFLPERPFTPEDLAAIEKRMGEIIKAGQRFARRPIGDDEARAELADEKFKLELIGLKGGGAEPDSADGASAEVGAGG